MTKIAFISTNDYAPWGGSEELWSQTAIRLAKEGLTIGVNIKGWTPEAQQVSKLEEAGCKVFRRSSYNSRLQRLIMRFNPKSNFVFLDIFNPNFVVISQGGNGDGLSWMEACLDRQIPFVVISQAASESLWPADEYATRLAKTYRQARQSFFVSHANLKLTEKQIAINLDNSKVIANPFKVSYDVKIDYPKDDHKIKLACVARPDVFAKGQDLLFEVFRMSKWKSRPIELSLFGKGDSEQSLINLKDLWNLENVNFCGYVDKIEAVWESHHALILPSRFEGLPIALVEAMLCARACIVTDIGGNGELIEDEVSGFIAVAPKVVCVDEALERAWHQRTSWEKIGQNAAAKVRQKIPRDPIGIFVEELKNLFL
jgi:glycosyltransferase involved in cell wall biosynthesis